MQRVSVFDMLKIGVGPSGSHTMGPWRAAQRFLAELDAGGLLPHIAAIQVDLLGSLAKTGKGHGTDVAVQLGLCGEDPVTIDVSHIRNIVADIAKVGQLNLAGRYSVPFQPDEDIRFRRDRHRAADLRLPCPSPSQAQQRAEAAHAAR